jgi:hypothetical protein
MSRTLFVLIAVFLFASSSFAQTKQAIAVRGDWTIEVRNPDGSLSAHYEFSNELLPSGELLLAGVMSGNFVPGLWRVTLDGQLCDSGACASAEKLAETDSPNRTFATLIVQRDNVSPPGLSPIVKMSGRIEVANTPSPVLSSVYTTISFCGQYTSPGACRAESPGYGYLFSQHVLEPKNLVQGQIVQFTVTFSFTKSTTTGTSHE